MKGRRSIIRSEKEEMGYAFIIKGSAEIEGQKIEERDGFGVWDIKDIDLKALTKGTEILLMEVPMTL
jgi:redox-sensitive bicupin YhaK (pirin superfamily)